VRRTTVPHPQRWRSPQQAGWSDRPAATGTIDGDRSFDRRDEVSASFVAGRFGRPVRRFRRMVVFAAGIDDGACWAEAKRAELEIFAVRNGWASDESRIAGEVLDYRPFEQRSEIFVATSAKDPSTPIGVARMIWGVADVPLEEQFLVTAVHHIDPEWVWMLNHVGTERVAEWATLGAVGSNLSPMFALWSAIYRAARARGVDYWVQSVVEELFSVYRDGFKTPMMQIGQREIVVGAESIPTVLPLFEIAVGQMLSWNADLKRSLFGTWVDRQLPVADEDDLAIA
jgi:hypothetical protein